MCVKKSAIVRQLLSPVLRQLLAMFARCVELHFRPAFLRLAQIHASVGKVGIVVIHVFGHASLVGFDEFVEMVRVGAGHPARG